MRLKIPFVGPCYRTRSSAVDNQKTLNMYLEYDEGSPRAPIALYGRPGLLRQWTFGTGPVRAGKTLGDDSYWLSGNSVYQRTSAGVETLLGTIGTSTGTAFMASNGLQILLVDGTSAGWIITSGSLVQITDDGFPAGVTWCDYLDGLFIVGGDGSGRFYISDLLDGSSWVATEFATAEGNPDKCIAGIVDHRELWLFGTSTIEVWYNSGNPTFPIERVGNAFIEHGCAAVASVAKADNTVFWLGSDDRGNGIVWRAAGYVPERISTNAIEFAISQYSDISDATAYTFQIEGHLFYILSFPSGDATWVYDVSNGQWVEWGCRDPSDNFMHRFRAGMHLFWNGVHYVGDIGDGRVYSLDFDTHTDDGDSILALRRTQSTQDSSNRMLFFSFLHVDCEMAVANADEDDPQLMMRYSDDGGNTWSNEQAASLGKTGQYNARATFSQLGSGRNRVWEVSITDPVKRVILGAIAEGVPGRF